MTIRTRAAALAIIGLLALPAGALAGGWATVGLSSTPDGLAPGATWHVDIEVLQHGRRPMTDVHPTVTIMSGETSRTFTTKPTGRPGVYRASVPFAQAGTWRYVVDDGFTQRHSYPAVQIGAGGVSGKASTLALPRLALAGLAGLLAAGLVLLMPRRRRGGVAALGEGG
jgi:hypothetical protein